MYGFVLVEPIWSIYICSPFIVVIKYSIKNLELLNGDKQFPEAFEGQLCIGRLVRVGIC